MQIDRDLPDGVTITDWGELLPEMREAIAAFDVSRMIFVTILYLATGLGILNTIFMSVMERSREFGIMMALGLKPPQIKRMVLLESLLLGLLGTAAGLVCGFGLSYYMAAVGIDLSGWITPVTYAGGTIQPRLKAVFEQRNFIDPAWLLIIVSLLAGYFPARRAAKLQPVEAIREE